MSVEKLDVKAIALADFNSVLADQVIEAIDSTPTERVPESLQRLFGAILIDASNLPSFPYAKTVKGENGEPEVVNQNPRDNARQYVEEAFTVIDEIFDARTHSEQIVD